MVKNNSLLRVCYRHLYFGGPLLHVLHKAPSSGCRALVHVLHTFVDVLHTQRNQLAAKCLLRYSPTDRKRRNDLIASKRYTETKGQTVSVSKPTDAVSCAAFTSCPEKRRSITPGVLCDFERYRQTSLERGHTLAHVH